MPEAQAHVMYIRFANARCLDTDLHIFFISLTY